MRLHQILTGAANTSENGASIGYGCVEDYPFIVYSSGCDVVILDSKFQRVQIVTRQCATSNHVGLISCSETDGKIAVAYGKRIRVFGPRTTTSSIQSKSLPFEWSQLSEFSTQYTLNCLVWDRDGRRLLTGGELLELWIESVETNEKKKRQLVWVSVWHCETPTPVHHVQFSSDGSYFASLGKHDCLLKVWFEIEKENPLSKKHGFTSLFYDFLYIPHPRPVTRFSWRKTSPFMPRNCVANVLLTSCADNVCRIWCETMEQKSASEFPNEPNPTPGHCERHKSIPKSTRANPDTASLRAFDLQSDHHFHIAASIDPAKHIPVMSTVSFFTATKNHSSFVLHWVNNKEMFMTSVTNLLLGSPSVTVEVESASSNMSAVSGRMTDSPYVDLNSEDMPEDSSGRDKPIVYDDSYEDLMFRGIYRGKQHHPDDLNHVIKKAVDIGVTKMMVTCGCLDDIKKGLELCKTRDDLYCTVGCHPTRCDEFEKDGDPDGYLDKLLNTIHSNKDKVVAVGECGLDYDRLHFCAKDTQLKYFEKQIDLAEKTHLPMFLHIRNAHDDFADIVKRHRDRIHAGVASQRRLQFNDTRRSIYSSNLNPQSSAHCFTGSKEEAWSLVDQGFYIGITGCSLKTEDNLEVVKSIPAEKLMIETDAPWCEIRPTHAGFKHVKTHFESKKKEKWQEGFVVKSRNEPGHLIQVLEVVAAIKEQSSSELAEIIYENSMNVFFSK